MKLEEQYKYKLNLIFKYIKDSNNPVTIIDYQYALSLLFKSIYVISENLIQEVKYLLNDINIDITFVNK